MEYSEVVYFSKMLEKEKLEIFKDNMVFSAFVGWQNYAMQGEKKAFLDYLDDLGLGLDSRKYTKEDRKKVAQRAYQTGERIMKLFKGSIK